MCKFKNEDSVESTGDMSAVLNKGTRYAVKPVSLRRWHRECKTTQPPTFGSYLGEKITNVTKVTSLF
jgi:hypothetical protein